MLLLRVHLRQLQGSHDGSEAEHVSHGALELSCDLDDFVKQACSLLIGPRAAQHVHGQHDRHGLKPAGARRRRFTLKFSSGSRSDLCIRLIKKIKNKAGFRIKYSEKPNPVLGPRGGQGLV